MRSYMVGSKTFQEIMEKAPAMIARLSEEYEDKRKEWTIAKEDLNVLEAKTLLVLSAKFPDDKVGEIKAKVSSNEDIYKLRLEVIGLESEYRQLDVKVESWINAYISARKFATLAVQEINNLETTKRGGL